MGFFDEYKEVTSSFISKAEKDVLMENGIPLTIQAVIRDDVNKFGPRFIANVLVPDPTTGDEEERAISFPIGTVDSRDRMMAELTNYLARTDAEPVRVKLEKVKNSILVRPA